MKRSLSQNIEYMAIRRAYIEVIERQRRSHIEIINLLCGCIIREGYINNISISTKQINEINFLISLTLNDFYNCLRMFSCCKDKGSSYRTKNIDKFGENLHSRMVNYLIVENKKKVIVKLLDGTALECKIE